MHDLGAFRRPKSRCDARSELLQDSPSGVAGVLSGLKDSFQGQLTDLKKQESQDKQAIIIPITYYYHYYTIFIIVINHFFYSIRNTV